MTERRMTHAEALDLAAGYVLGALEPAEEDLSLELGSERATCRIDHPVEERRLVRVGPGERQGRELLERAHSSVVLERSAEHRRDLAAHRLGRAAENVHLVEEGEGRRGRPTLRQLAGGLPRAEIP